MQILSKIILLRIHYTFQSRYTHVRVLWKIYIYNTHEKNIFYKRYNQTENDIYINHYEIIDSSAWRYHLLETIQNLEICHQKNPLFVAVFLVGYSLLESGMAIPIRDKRW